MENEELVCHHQSNEFWKRFPVEVANEGYKLVLRPSLFVFFGKDRTVHNNVQEFGVLSDPLGHNCPSSSNRRHFLLCFLSFFDVTIQNPQR